MRTCTQCEQPKLESAEFFHTRLTRSGERVFHRVCKECRNKKIRKWTKAHRAEAVQRTAEWKKRNPRRSAEQQAEYRTRLRQGVLKAYGGDNPRCKCCGEDEKKFLVIDHENGGGNKHRRSLAKSPGKMKRDIYAWLRQKGFPPGFRILCHNCNMARGIYGHCPHERPVSSMPAQSSL